MSDTFKQASGRKVLSRASAQELGSVGHLLMDAERRQVVAVIIGRGKKAQFIDWGNLTGFGPDAVMVSEEAALRPAADDRERAAADGKLEIVGKRSLTEAGNELGTIDDVIFNPDTGEVETLRIEGRGVPAGSLLGSGSYAVVLDASQILVARVRHRKIVGSRERSELPDSAEAVGLLVRPPESLVSPPVELRICGRERQ